MIAALRVAARAAVQEPVAPRLVGPHDRVGRGKTWIMDLFFQSLPFKNKQRSHFHRFMQSVHDELKKHPDTADPLELVADKIAGRPH